MPLLEAAPADADLLVAVECRGGQPHQRDYRAAVYERKPPL
ncbi:MAG: hypothetical protein QM805_23860 [Pseudomonas sp.]